MENPPVHFFISGKEKKVLPGSKLWEFPLSGKRTHGKSGLKSGTVSQGTQITIGDFFSAAWQAISNKEDSILMAGLEAVFQRPVSGEDIHCISVFLEKHGAFYHPLKIKVDLKESQTLLFVLNGAVSKPGLALIETEYYLISRLNKIFSKQYLPRVFGLNILKTNHGRIGFFLGEWFENYKEFHITDGQGQRQIVIWESDGGCRYLPVVNALPIYREISRILTAYYNIETFEQIFPWHHAAGDFIVKQIGGQFHVRLITVRGYSSLTDFGSGESDIKIHILPSLLFFFFNLTLRMRLDRLDGTGKIVWLGDEVLGATVEGFLTALDEKSKDYNHGDLKMSIIAFVKGWSLDQVMNIMVTLIEPYDISPTENRLIMENLETHCRVLEGIFKTF